ncbi:MAG: DUF3592 domain-containing protein [Pseudomonadales bacterium]|nr:DUF3592 domain-containing protein [Pseudomonadales bacterium]
MNRSSANTKRRKVDYQLVVGYLLVVIGGALTVWLFNAVILGLQTYQWNTTPAIIYLSKSQYSASSPTDKTQGLYKIDIGYRYNIDGEKYLGTKINHTDLPLLRLSEAEILLQKYNVGSVQVAYFDPTQPASAVLIQGINRNIMMLLGLALLFFIVGTKAIRRNRISTQTRL